MEKKNKKKPPISIEPFIRLHGQYAFSLYSLLAGLLYPFAFAPYEHRWLVFPCLIWLLYSLYRAPSLRQALVFAWLFGVGSFAGGVYWVYYALSIYGEASAWLALLATVLFVVLLACFYCLFALPAWWLRNRLQPAYWFVYMALLWSLFEWLRSWLFSGFPWLLSSTTQIDSLLSGWFALSGSYGVSFLLMLLCASVLALALLEKTPAKKCYAVLLVLLLVLSFLLKGKLWVEPLPEPIKVALVQGNIEQSLKFQPGVLSRALEQYNSMSQQYLDNNVIIWPETAIPTFYDRVQGWFDYHQNHYRQTQTQLFTGIFTRPSLKSASYYNSFIELTGKQQYNKRHLVPFGEYIPFRTLLAFIARFMQIPMSDLQPGKPQQGLVTMAGLQAAVSICFESAYSHLFHYPGQQVNLLVNISNDAWFADSTAPWQHLEIARVRSMEYQKPMLRVTNNGISAFIDFQGNVVGKSQQFQAQVLEGKIYPVTGTTPFERWQNRPLFFLWGALALLLFYFGRLRTEKQS